MKIKYPYISPSSRRFAGLASVILLTQAQSQATDVTWTGASTGGSWNTPSNWSSTVLPSTTDTVSLGDVATNRTISVDTVAAGTIAGLTWGQTSAFTNTLVVSKNLTVTNAIALGATSGTSSLIIRALADTNVVSLTASGGITVSAGGSLTFDPANSTSNAARPTLTGNLTMTGGNINLLSQTGYSGSALVQVTGNFAMSGGTLNFKDISSDRFEVDGNFSATGGSISVPNSVGTYSLVLGGATVGFSNTALSSKVGLSIQGGTQSVTTDTTLNAVELTGWGAGTKIKTISSTAAGQGIGSLKFTTQSGNNIGLKLGSDLNLSSGASMPTSANTTGTASIDVNGHNLNLSSAGSVWVLSNIWALSGAGAIKSTGFNSSAATVSTVGAGLVLESNGGNGTANNLSGTGAVDAASTFRYSGSATTDNAATLTSNRAIGNLEVTGGGALALIGTINVAGSTTVSAGTLQIGNGTAGSLISAGGVSVSSGATLSGSGTIGGAVTSSGTINGKGLSLGATTMNGVSTLSGTTSATSIAITGGTATITGTTSTSSGLTVGSGSILKLNGSLGGSATVLATGTLGGNGTITGSTTIQGTLAAGNSIGTVNTGDLVLASTSTLDVELGRNVTTATSDLTSVTGSVEIVSGADLKLTLYNTLSPLVNGDIIFLIDNDGTDAVNGVFTSLNGTTTTLVEGSTFTWNSQTLEITYKADSATSSFTSVNGNDVALMVVPEPSTWAMLVGGVGMLAFGQRLRRRAIK